MPLQRKRSWMNWDGCEPDAAWQPLYAPSYHDSLWNWRNGFAAIGVSPTFAPAVGWLFAGAEYLDTGIVGAQDQSGSLMVSYSNALFNDGCFMGNYRTTADAAFMVQGQVGAAKVWWYNGMGFPSVLVSSAAAPATGVLGIAGRRGYIGGVAESGTIPASPATGTMRSMYLGAINFHLDTDAPGYYFSGEIRAAAIWHVTLAPEQMWQRLHMLAHLENPDWSVWTPARRYYFAPTAATVFQAAWAERASRLIGGS